MKLTKSQLKRIIKEEKAKLLSEIQGSDNPLMELEDAVAAAVENLLTELMEDYSLENMDYPLSDIEYGDLQMAVARGVDRAKAILRY